MKRVITYGLSLALVLSLTACTPTQEDAPEDTSTPEVTEPADTSTPEQTAPAEPDDQEPQETAASSSAKCCSIALIPFDRQSDQTGSANSGVER